MYDGLVLNNLKGMCQAASPRLVSFTPAGRNRPAEQERMAAKYFPGAVMYIRIAGKIAITLLLD